MQKALRSSSPALIKLSFLFMAAVVLLSGCGVADSPQSSQPVAPSGAGAAASPAEGETAGPSGPAVLQTGPVERRGILVLPANAIRHHEGLYLHGGFRVTVRYTEEEIVLPSGWVTRRCGTLPVLFTVENGILHYGYSAEEEWYVFFEIPENYGRDCAFIERFLQRLRYFKSVTDSGEYVPFPAVIELL